MGRTVFLVLKILLDDTLHLDNRSVSEVAGTYFEMRGT